MTRCPGHARHWFALHVGVIVPSCVRCGAPNPRFSARQWQELQESDPDIFEAYWQGKQ